MNDARLYVSHVPTQGVENTLGEDRTNKGRRDYLSAPYKAQEDLS
jgi:hypothetical protein